MAEPIIYKINGIEITSNHKIKNYKYVECFSEILQKELENMNHFDITSTEVVQVANDCTLRMAICLGVLDKMEGDYMIGGVKRGFTPHEQTVIAKFVKRELYIHKRIEEDNLTDINIEKIHHNGIRF